MWQQVRRQLTAMPSRDQRERLRVAPPRRAARWAPRQAPGVYARLREPHWAPPQAAFGPVWTVLYVLLGGAGLAAGEPAAKVLVLHLAQLALNALWPAAFFGGRRRQASLEVIGAPDATSAADIALVARTDPPLPRCSPPYLAWCGFPTALNVAASDPASCAPGPVAIRAHYPRLGGHWRPTCAGSLGLDFSTPTLHSRRRRR